MGRRSMANHSVTLRVISFLRIECKFWLTDDGWNGSCEQPPPSLFKRTALNMQNPKWKWGWGSTLSPFYAKPNHQAQVRLRKDDSGLNPPESWQGSISDNALCL